MKIEVFGKLNRNNIGIIGVSETQEENIEKSWRKIVNMKKMEKETELKCKRSNLDCLIDDSSSIWVL